MSSLPNTISGTRCIDGMTIKFKATFDPATSLWKIVAIDHHGEHTHDVVDPTSLWSAIGKLVDEAVATSRTAIEWTEAR